MKSTLKYIFITLFALLSLTSCDDGYEENLEQQEDIVYFLENTHSPTLIAESLVAESLDLNPPFYTISGNYTYRYISNYYDDGREELNEVLYGSTITILFDLYTFTGSAIDEETTLPAYSNKSSDEEKFILAGLNTELWDFSPLDIKIGSGDLLTSIEEALVGCREGDEVFIYLTRNMAYGSGVIGLIDAEAMLRFSCTIEAIE